MTAVHTKPLKQASHLTSHEVKILALFRAGATAWFSASNPDVKSAFLVGVEGQERINRNTLDSLMTTGLINCRAAGCDWEYYAVRPEDLDWITDAQRTFLKKVRAWESVAHPGPYDDRRISLPLYRKGLLSKSTSDVTGTVYWHPAW